ncbi:MAG: AbrB/MazE/SpoVT family DNA-binding domain-containing protein [Methylococcales symbiont of Hymedesmia sp. n. MRB-2018]|nr:MAG: AbrB/MazE/SpoVT family DNA-binding domain-containing protein [Methylococcales symbiont of Hymedesmia sp. n. MRB-2018]KAF3984649.1 MAG: AbrB/MazE/SpoVT family DNA-binding domain-containing protein [Methylococcales symbiont of Hymedesmia sp. n. MRB-2018]
MAHLVKIGNSQGIRIPKPLIEQAHLEGKELKFQVLNGGLFIAPVLRPREGWAKEINETLMSCGAENIDQEWLNSELTSNKELEW